MANYSSPNLPSRDFDETQAFYAQLGFSSAYRHTAWMILENGDLVIEFFPYPNLDPAHSSFSCCLRLDDLGAMMAQIKASTVAEGHIGIPRYHAPKVEPSGLTIAYLVDPDGSLIRSIQND